MLSLSIFPTVYFIELISVTSEWFILQFLSQVGFRDNEASNRKHLLHISDLLLHEQPPPAQFYNSLQ